MPSAPTCHSGWSEGVSELYTVLGWGEGLSEMWISDISAWPTLHRVLHMSLPFLSPTFTPGHLGPSLHHFLPKWSVVSVLVIGTGGGREEGIL